MPLLSLIQLYWFNNKGKRFTLQGSRSYLAASLRSLTLLSLLSPSLKMVWLATVKIPFLVMKSGKHRWRTEAHIWTCFLSLVVWQTNNELLWLTLFKVVSLTRSAWHDHRRAVFIAYDFCNWLKGKTKMQNTKFISNHSFNTVLVIVRDGLEGPSTDLSCVGFCIYVKTMFPLLLFIICVRKNNDFQFKQNQSV